MKTVDQQERIRQLEAAFARMTNRDFILMFCRHMKCAPTDVVTRIEFRYVADQLAPAVGA